MPGDVSARELTEQVWQETAAELALATSSAESLAEYRRLVEDGERHYVNSRYVLDRLPHDPRGTGHLDNAKQRLRRRAALFVLHVLTRYLDDEQEFLAHLVRLQNTITLNVDRVSSEIRQVETLLQQEVQRLHAADTVLHGRLEARIAALEVEVLRPGRNAGNRS